jgi:hypothetical protein
MESEDTQLAAVVRAEVGGWKPDRGPDVADLMRRADHAWRRPVALASSIGATVLAVLLLMAMLMVVLAPPIPGGETIRAHLVGP